jgi:hypothetical protein
LEILDEMDGIYKGDYLRTTFLILGEDGKFHSAELYKVIDPKGPFTPSKDYVEGMLIGAKEIGLEPDYIKIIENFYEDGK